MQIDTWPITSPIDESSTGLVRPTPTDPDLSQPAPTDAG